MITLNNYKEKTKSINFSQHPTESEGHEFVVENLDLYDHDPDIKSFIDTHIQRMNSLVQQVSNEVEKPVKKEAKVKKIKKAIEAQKEDKEYIKKQIEKDEPIDHKKIKSGKIAVPELAPEKDLNKEYAEALKNKDEEAITRIVTRGSKVSAVKSKKVKPTPKLVEKITPEIGLLRRLLRLVNREVHTDKIRLLANAIQKAMVEKIIRKTSDIGNIITELEAKLRIVINTQKKSVKLNIEEAKLNKWVSLAGGEKVYPSVKIIKRFISMQGQPPVPEKVQALKDYIKKSKISKEDPYYKQLESIKKALASRSAIINVTKQELNGFEGIINACGCEEISGLDDLPKELAKEIEDDGFVRADQGIKVEKQEIFRLPDEMGKFLQNMQRFKAAITLKGNRGAGKTTFLFKLINSFIGAGYPTAFFDLEQGGMGSKDTEDLVNKYISPQNRKELAITGEAKNGIETVKKYAKKFPVIAIDSWGKLKVSQHDFDKLRHEYPNTIFIVIFQETSSGETRGGNAPEFDATIVLQAVTGNSFEENYIYPEKNRGNRTDVKYMIASGKTLNR